MRRLNKLAQWIAAHIAVGSACAVILLYGCAHEKQYQEEIQHAQSTRSTRA